MHETANDGGPRPWLWGALAFVLACPAYLLLARDTFYKGDAQAFVAALYTGAREHPYHVLYLPILHGLRAVLAPRGASAFHVAAVASAGGTALGVALMLVALIRSRIDLPRAVLASLLIACAPSVVLFAAVVEIHGVFFAFTGAAWLGAIALERALARARGAILRGALCGGATAFAAGVHALGHLLPFVLLSWIAAGQLQTSRWRGLLGTRLPSSAAVLLLVHGAIYAGLDLTFGAPYSGPPTAASLEHFARGPGRLLDVGLLARTFVAEWLVPYLPVSCLFVAALAGRAHRTQAAALALLVLAYGWLTCKLLAGDVEYGAYLAPLVFPAALASATVLPRWCLAAGVLVAASVAATRLGDGAGPVPARELIADLQRVTVGERPVFVIGSRIESDSIVRYWPEVRFVAVFDWVGGMVVSGAYEVLCARFDALVNEWWAQGRTVYVTDPAFGYLARAPAPMQRFAHEHLPGRYRLSRIVMAEFAIVRLDRRP